MRKEYTRKVHHTDRGYIYIYIYIYMCVCVCVSCVSVMYCSGVFLCHARLPWCVCVCVCVYIYIYIYVKAARVCILSITILQHESVPGDVVKGIG